MPLDLDSLRKYDTPTVCNVVERPKVNFQGTAWGVAFHRGRVLGVGGGNGGVFWSWTADQPLSATALTLPGNARDLAMHPDGRRFAVPFDNGFVRLYDMGPKAM